jgi:hypothetical protein
MTDQPADAAVAQLKEPAAVPLESSHRETRARPYVSWCTPNYRHRQTAWYRRLMTTLLHIHTVARGAFGRSVWHILTYHVSGQLLFIRASPIPTFFTHIYFSIRSVITAITVVYTFVTHI